MKKGYKDELSLEQATALTAEATLRKTADAENLLIATIERKTKKLKELTLEEKMKIVEKVYH